MLTLFPNRIAIGRWKDQLDPSAKEVPVYMSPEFERALSALFERVGGSNATDLSSLELLAAASAPPMPDFGPLVDAPSAQVVDLLAAQLAEANKDIVDVQVQLAEAVSGLTELRKQ